MSNWELGAIAAGCLAYLCIGVAIAGFFTSGFGDPPRNRLLRVPLRIFLIFGWLPAIPLYWVLLFFAWLLS